MKSSRDKLLDAFAEPKKSKPQTGRNTDEDKQFIERIKK